MCETFKAGDPQKPVTLTGVGMIIAIIVGMFMLSAANESGLTDNVVDKIPKTNAAQARIEGIRSQQDAQVIRNR